MYLVEIHIWSFWNSLQRFIILPILNKLRMKMRFSVYSFIIIYVYYHYFWRKNFCYKNMEMRADGTNEMLFKLFSNILHDITSKKNIYIYLNNNLAIIYLPWYIVWQCADFFRITVQCSIIFYNTITADKVKYFWFDIHLMHIFNNSTLK